MRSSSTAAGAKAIAVDETWPTKGDAERRPNHPIVSVDPKPEPVRHSAWAVESCRRGRCVLSRAHKRGHRRAAIRAGGCPSKSAWARRPLTSHIGRRLDPKDSARRDSSAVANRWRDPTKGVLIVVMQRLHVDDFTAFLLHARPDTVHLKIPAVAPCDLEYEVGGGKRYIFREGELLEPDRLSHEFLQEMRALQGLSHYNSQYLQEPLVSGGRIIEPNWFRRFQAPRKHDYRVISIDPAFTQDGGDHSAAIICNFVGLDIEIIHAERVQLAFTGLVQWVRGLDQKWSPDAFVIEAIGTGRGFCDHLRHGLGMNNVHFVESHGPNDKVQRMELASPKVEAGRVWLPYFGEFVQPFLDEVVQFPFAPCDDWADALSQLVLYFEKIWERARNITRPSSHRLRPPSLRDAGGRVSIIAVRSGPGRCGTPALRHKVTERVR